MYIYTTHTHIHTYSYFYLDLYLYFNHYIIGWFGTTFWTRRAPSGCVSTCSWGAWWPRVCHTMSWCDIPLSYGHQIIGNMINHRTSRGIWVSHWIGETSTASPETIISLNEIGQSDGFPAKFPLKILNQSVARLPEDNGNAWPLPAPCFGIQPCWSWTSSWIKTVVHGWS